MLPGRMPHIDPEGRVFRQPTPSVLSTPIPLDSMSMRQHRGQYQAAYDPDPSTKFRLIDCSQSTITVRSHGPSLRIMILADSIPSIRGFVVSGSLTTRLARSSRFHHWIISIIESLCIVHSFPIVHCHVQSLQQAIPFHPYPASALALALALSRLLEDSVLL